MMLIRPVFCLLLLFVIINAQSTVKVGFFYDGLLSDGGFLQSTNDGLLQLSAKYGTRVELGYHGPTEGVLFGELLRQ